MHVLTVWIARYSLTNSGRLYRKYVLIYQYNYFTLMDMLHAHNWVFYLSKKVRKTKCKDMWRHM